MLIYGDNAAIDTQAAFNVVKNVLGNRRCWVVINRLLISRHSPRRAVKWRQWLQVWWRAVIVLCCEQSSRKLDVTKWYITEVNNNFIHTIMCFEVEDESQAGEGQTHSFFVLLYSKWNGGARDVVSRLSALEQQLVVTLVGWADKVRIESTMLLEGST